MTGFQCDVCNLFFSGENYARLQLAHQGDLLYAVEICPDCIVAVGVELGKLPFRSVCRNPRRVAEERCAMPKIVPAGFNDEKTAL